jgi:hypothetical protein
MFALIEWASTIRVGGVDYVQKRSALVVQEFQPNNLQGYLRQWLVWLTR